MAQARGAHALVVDDDIRLRELLQRYLVENGFRVSSARDAEDARRQLAGLRFDLVVLDVMMPGEDGLSLARWIRATGTTPILMLTAMGEASDRIGGFESGVDDYLTKPFEPRELVLRLEAILRRAGEAAPGERVRFGDCVFDIQRGELRRDGRPVRLTSAEAALLKVFARNPGGTISREELLRGSEEGNPRTVDVQITRLRRKIEADPRAPRHLQTVWGQGYVLWSE